MKMWLKNINKYFALVILIISLLIVEVICNLSLPGYTSKIIDDGIVNYGVTTSIPEEITEKNYKLSSVFMDKNEAKSWEDAYKKDGNIYKLKEMDKKEIENLNNSLTIPLILSDKLSNLDKNSFKQMMAQLGPVNEHLIDTTTYPYDARAMFIGLKEDGKINENTIESIRKNLKEKLNEAGGNELQKNIGVSFAKKMEKEAGVNLTDKQHSYLVKTGGMMILLAVILTACMILVTFFAAKIGASVSRDMRKKVYTKVMSFSNEEIEKFGSASLITRTTNDIQQVGQTTTLLLRMALIAPIMVVGGIIKVMSTGAGMGWTIALAVISMIGIIMFLLALVMPKFKVMQKLIDNVNRIAREIITGLPVIRAFETEKKEEKRFNDANVLLYKTQVFANKTMSFMMPAFTFILFGLTALIVYVGAGKIAAGNMQIGQMTAFITYAMQIVMSFLFLTILAVIVPRAAVAAKRIEEVVNTNSSIVNKENAIELKEAKGEIEFRDVSFSYKGSSEVALKNISFTAKAGKTTAIIGATGCGKSSLVQLIPRLYDVTNGKILFDGVDIRDINLHSLRKEIGYVPQKAVLFSGTISSNITYGMREEEENKEEAMYMAAEISQAKDFILGFENKFENAIAQGGTNVSGGQKQRISIARAIAKSPKVLIFDDSFSALDLKTDKMLRKALNEKKSDVTTIVVAQRVSTIMNADNIIVMEKGKIVGTGKHEDLLKNCETYREIATSQMGTERGE